MSDIWLVTINDKEHTEPLCWGMFDNPRDMTTALFQAGITGEANEVPLRNPDGGMASLLLMDEMATASITRMPEHVARGITDLDFVVWDVPDSLDGIDGFDLPTDTESE